MVGAAISTDGHSFMIALTSSLVSVCAPPEPVRRPPLVVEPGSTRMMLLPMLAICWEMT